MSEENRIGLLIKQYRKEKNWTQNDLSEATGLSVSGIKNYEIGRKNPKIETLKTIADALDKSIFDFIDIPITSPSDVMSFLNLLCKQTDTKIIEVRDENGKPVPNSIGLAFQNNEMFERLFAYNKALNSLDESKNN